MTDNTTPKAGRRPADGALDSRQLVWTALRGADNQWLPIKVLSDDLGVNRKTARDYLLCLEAGGFVERGLDADQVCDRARLLRDGGFHAPRLRRDGTPVTQGAGVNNLWRSMRMLKSFNARDLALHSSTPTITVTENTAKSYCAMLFATGFLRVLQRANPGKGQLAVYRLIRNDGPKPPMIQRVKQVYDPNTQRVYQKAGQA